MKDNKPIQSMLEQLAQETIHPEQIDLWPALRARLAARRLNRPKEFSMKKRIVLSAGAAVLFAALLGFVLIRNVTPVSARTILDKAYASQSASAPTQGIEHFRIETYENIEAKPEDQGTSTVVESYSDLESGKFRIVTTEKKSGKVFYVAAYDGQNSYNHDGGKTPDTAETPLKVYRSPQDGTSVESQKLRLGSSGVDDPKDVFDRMRADPNVEYTGQETWSDGRTVYVLRSHQEIKVIKENELEHPVGQVSVYFDASTYKMVGSTVTMEKDGHQLLITSQRILANEILPAGTSVAWDLSDVAGLNIVDDADGEHALPVVISARELRLKTSGAYLLKSIPDGFTLEITVLAKQPKDEPYFYEATYSNKDGEYFQIRVWPRKLNDVDVSWSDETYTTTSGLVLYMMDDQGTTLEGTPRTFPGGLMQAPGGSAYGITTTMSRETLKAWMENLVLLK